METFGAVEADSCSSSCRVIRVTQRKSRCLGKSGVGGT